MKIRVVGDPVLREPTAAVSIDELPGIIALIPAMIQLMNDAQGVGLAANQVGISKQFFIIKLNDQIELIVNPEIISTESTQKYNEGCLSIPGISVEMERALNIRLRFRDKEFNEVEREFSGVEAVMIQHEIDHLHGKLSIDSLGPVRKMMVMKRYSKLLKIRGDK
jgi:peptide deformylase